MCCCDGGAMEGEMSGLIDANLSMPSSGGRCCNKATRRSWESSQIDKHHMTMKYN